MKKEYAFSDGNIINAVCITPEVAVGGLKDNYLFNYCFGAVTLNRECVEIYYDKGRRKFYAVEIKKEPIC